MSKNNKDIKNGSKVNSEIPIDFNTFILSLSSSAVYHMGIATYPEHGAACTNLPMAKQTIDILSLLRDKTAGNLNAEEDLLLEQLIGDLQLKYNNLLAACGC
ncbi:MAG: DUF1844 domain-containing protein [Deltaproteobacteria bacterium]|nr:DUF1844 domain-containing protein [Deltaproteobacteria bacterium]